MNLYSAILLIPTLAFCALVALGLMMGAFEPEESGRGNAANLNMESSGGGSKNRSCCSASRESKLTSPRTPDLLAKPNNRRQHTRKDWRTYRVTLAKLNSRLIQ